MLKIIKNIVQNRNNDTDSQIAFSILKGLIFIAIIIILIIVCLGKLSSDYSIETYINNTKLTEYDKEKNALNQSTFLEFSDTCIISFDTNNLHGISITLDGQTSEMHLFASTEAAQVAQNLGLAEITVDNGSFTFNANSNFEVGEIVLLTVEYNGSDNDFGSDITTKYFAFKVSESKEPESSSGTTISTTNYDDSNTDMAASVYFNGVTVATYDSRENAVTNCERSHTTSFDVLVEPNDIDRVIVSTYLYEQDTDVFRQNGDEVFIYDNNNWSTHMDLSRYVGRIVVIKIRLESARDDVIGGNRFFAIKLED